MSDPHHHHHHEPAQDAPPPPSSPAARTSTGRGGWIVLALLAVAILVGRSLIFVDQTESVHVTEFGRTVALIEQPGLHFKWPHQSARAFDRRLQIDTPAPREMLTRDKKNLEVAWSVSWRIGDVPRFLRSVRTLPDASARLEDMTASVLAAELVDDNLPDLVKAGPASGLDRLMTQVTRRVASQANEEYGLTVVDVRLRRLNYPEEVRAAIFEQIRSERQRVAAATRAEGESQARTIRSAADLERSRTLAEAEAEAARIVGEGEAEAARIANDAHAVDPEFYQFLKTLETYRTALDTRTTLVLSADSAFLRVLTQGTPEPGGSREASAATRPGVAGGSSPTGGSASRATTSNPKPGVPVVGAPR
ncbi:MAG: protease modulator HflC [Isosphaeraceae bacterium]